MTSGRYTPNLGNNSSYSNGKMSQELDKIKVALDNVVSRYADQPNQMESDLDMNSNRILNLLDAVNPSEAVTLRQAEVLTGGLASPKYSLYTSSSSGAYNVPVQISDNAVDYMVYVDGVRQTPDTDYTVKNGKVEFTPAIGNGLSVLIVGFKPNVTTINKEFQTPVEIQTVTLLGGQTNVAFSVPVNNGVIRVWGANVDDGELFEGLHFTPNGETAITLKNSYPEGTKVTLGVPVERGGAVEKRVEPETKRQVIAHRGFADLAPENTLAAISQAYSLGAHGVEFDVMCTSDNVPVLMHDLTVDRTTNGTGYLKDLTLAQVKSLDAGSWFHPVFNRCQVPTLEDTLKYCRGRFERIHLEIKGFYWTKAQIQTTIDMVQRLGLDGAVIYISYNRGALDWVREYQSDAKIGYIDVGYQSGKTARGEVLELSQKYSGGLYCSMSGLSGDPTFTEYARSLGVQVYGKVFNSMEQHEDGAINHGISTIHSDNACGATRRYNSGTPCHLNSDYSNATQNVGSGSITIDAVEPSNQKLVIQSNAGTRTGIEFGMFYDRFGEITVGFFASLRSYNGGLFGVFSDDLDYAYDNELEVTSDDVLYYETTFRTKLNSSRSASEIDHRLMFIGGGSAADGECEFFRFRILNDSKLKELSGLAKGLIKIDGGAATIHRLRNSYGILDLTFDGTFANELNVKLDCAVDNTKYAMSGWCQIRGSAYEETHFVTVQGFFHDNMNIRVHRYDGTPVDISTLNDLYIDVLVS